MPTISCYITDADYQLLVKEARERGRSIPDLAECAIAETCCDIRRNNPIKQPKETETKK